MYMTEFDGHLEICPPLPYGLVDIVNKLCSYRNNADGDGDIHSFDGMVHHLHGRPEGSTWSMHKSKKDGTSKTPSVWCHWSVANRGLSKNKRQTVLEWDRAEDFNDYMYWLQYLIDFITLLAKKQFGIDIISISGEITWEGVHNQDDQGVLTVVRRPKPEQTGFYPDDFLPLPKADSWPTRHVWHNRELEVSPAPKGTAFCSAFGVEARVRLRKPLGFARFADLELDSGVSRGEYVIAIEQEPDQATMSLVFHLHHTLSGSLTHPDDPVLYHTEKDPNDPTGMVDRTAVHQPLLVHHQQPASSTDDDAAERVCAACHQPFQGPENRMAVWHWPYGYNGANMLAIYCQGCSP